MDAKSFDINEPQNIIVRNTNRLDLGAAVAMNFFGHCFNWFSAAQRENEKIRIVIDYDPNDGIITADFAKRD